MKTFFCRDAWAASKSATKNTKKSNTDKKTQHPKNGKNKQKKSIFNFVAEEDSLDYYLNNNAGKSSDDGEDTFDIFSSQDSLTNDDDLTERNALSSKNKDKVEMVRFAAADLKIDLGQLSGDDECNEKAIKDKTSNYCNNDDAQDENNNEEQNELNQNNDIIISSVASTSRQQYPKPDNIPNLMLDLMDDDKSQSVAASLAKSLCKEIDYKQEMEMIYKKNVETSLDDNESNITKLNRKKVNTINNSNNNYSPHVNATIHHFGLNVTNTTNSNHANTSTNNNNFNYTNNVHTTKNALNNKQVFLPMKIITKK